MSVVHSEAELVKQRLAGLREQRRALRLSSEEVAQRTREAVAVAQKAGVSIAEIARLLDMDRSSVYRTYISASA